MTSTSSAPDADIHALLAEVTALTATAAGAGVAVSIPSRQLHGRPRLSGFVDDLVWGLWGTTRAITSTRPGIAFFNDGQRRPLRAAPSLSARSRHGCASCAAPTSWIEQGADRSPSEHAVEAKADTSPVTETDRGIEAPLRAEIRRTGLTGGILGEEEGSNLRAARTWVIDPIDGTEKRGRRRAVERSGGPAPLRQRLLRLRPARLGPLRPRRGGAAIYDVLT